MKRRSFVKASLLTSAAGALIPQISMASETFAQASQEFYELRVYSLKNEQQQKLVEGYFKDAAIPALNRLGNKNIGKLEMFNDAGEIDIFKRLGFNPVFFGETLIGELRPNLIYMITFDDMEAHDNHWKAFVADPEWKKISAIPDYADAKLVSRITSTILTPSACSQI
jgi:hypothetical protein